VIGDGPLLASLRLLGRRLGLLDAQALRFTGWLTKTELPRALAIASVVVNPSQSETFCISNLQVMSMGLPLVSFGVEGMGEYISLNTPNPFMSSSSSPKLGKRSHFQVLDNAIVVDEASPRALFAALNWVFAATLGGGCGSGGEEALAYLKIKARDTAVTRFGVSVQMQKYADLYRQIVATAKAGNKSYRGLNAALVT
jgi:glycosyltransferase involved in cell wall biosynthesis